MQYFVHDLDPTLIKFGFIQIRWYGLMYVLGFFIGYLILVSRWKKSKFALNPDQIGLLITYLMIGMIVGARLIYVFVYDYWNYIQNPLEIFAVWKGGLSYHGAAIGFIVSSVLVAKKLNVGFFHIMDNVVIAACIGIALGRVGNFINGELVGRVTDVPWAVVFPMVDSMPRHPSQIYQALSEGILIFLILVIIEKSEIKKGFFKSSKSNKWLRTGIISTSYLIIYGVFRFVIEFFRQPDNQLGFFLQYFSMGQILCFIMILSGVILLHIRIKHPIEERIN